MVRACVVALAILGLTACGGGGGGSGGGGGGGVAVVPTPTPTATPTPTPTPTATTPAAPTWTQNVFQASSSLENLCATVRTGADILGDPFPDKPGTLLHELFWLRSWTRETYLWNTEVADQNPASFTDRIAYFNTLKTSATATSGKPKDQFHFALLTSDYLAQAVSAPSAGYGAEIKIFAGAAPRDVRVIYTQAGTPAAELLAGTPKLSRGAKLLVADGIDVVNGATTQAQITTLDNAVFPKAAGEAHTFTVQYPNGSTRSISLTSAAVVEAPVNRTAVLTTPTGPVGYMLLNTFSPYSSEKAVADAIASLKSSVVTDLVIDLRYNGGGLLAVASQLGYQVAGAARTSGRVFERLQFNAAAGGNDPVTGQTNSPVPFLSTGLGFSLANGTALQTLNLSRVFILSTSSTCSASEAVINGLRGVDVQVVLIGGTTCGKPYGFYPADNCGETYFSIQFQGVNDKSFGDYADGFAPSNSSAAFAVKLPGCSATDDFSNELGSGAESMLAAALNYRATGTCFAPVAVDLTPARVSEGPSMETSGRSAAAEFLRNNRDLHMPGRTSP